MPLPASRYSFRRVKSQQVASRDPVKYAPNLRARVGVQICRCGFAFRPAIEIEAQPVALDSAGTTLERLYAATSAKSAVVHVGSIGEIPDLLPWPAVEVSASIAIIVARQEPGPPDKPAQLGSQSSNCLAHQQFEVPDNVGSGNSADLRPRQCVPAVGGGVKAIFSRRRSISNPP
jgi:hypothetical protein